MNLTPPTNSRPSSGSPAATGALAARSQPPYAQRFTSLLTKASGVPEQERHGQNDDQRTRKAAQQLVASALVLPMLQQIRDSPLKSDLFHGGSAEDKFGQQLDTILADRITGSAKWPITDAVVKRVTPTRPPASSGTRLDRHG